MSSVNETYRYRWQVASRILAAVIGGYALTSAVTVLLSLLWPLPPAEAITAATMLSFTFYAVIIIWIFAVNNLRAVWIGLVLATVFCSGLSWLLLPGVSP